MSLTLDEVKKIVHLARLEASAEEMAALQKNLDDTLKLAADMNRVDTAKILPLAHPFDEVQPLRMDQVNEINQRELFQKIAPQVSAGLYIVPQVIETE